MDFKKNYRIATMKGDGVRRILVVEDEPLLRMAVVDLVEQADFTALGAGNADQALAILERRNDIRIVLTDIDMPGSLDGVALAWAVRARWRAIKGERNEEPTASVID